QPVEELRRPAGALGQRVGEAQAVDPAQVQAFGSLPYCVSSSSSALVSASMARSSQERPPISSGSASSQSSISRAWKRQGADTIGVKPSIDLLRQRSA